MDGNLEKEVEPNAIINKNITFFLNNIEKNNYLLDICLYDDNNNIIKNCSTKLYINIIDNNKNKLNFEITDNDIEEIYKFLCDGYNIENMGVKIDKIKEYYNEYSKNIDENVSKEEFKDGLIAYIIDNLYY